MRRCIVTRDGTLSHEYISHQYMCHMSTLPHETGTLLNEYICHMSTRHTSTRDTSTLPHGSTCHMSTRDTSTLPHETVQASQSDRHTGQIFPNVCLVAHQCGRLRAWFRA